VLALVGTGLFWVLTPGAAPVLAHIEPKNGSVVTDLNRIAIMGQTQPDATVLINGEAAYVNSNGDFALQVMLDGGFNVFDIIGIGNNGNVVTTEISIFYIPAHSNDTNKVTAQTNAPLLGVTYNGMNDSRI
jgi:hypothetical protein